MNIQIITRHGELSDVTREKIANKVAKLERYIDRVSGIQILVDLDKTDWLSVEVAVLTDWKKDFRAAYSGGELFGCLDQIVDKLSQQMKKFKDKVNDRRGSVVA